MIRSNAQQVAAQMRVNGKAARRAAVDVTTRFGKVLQQTTQQRIAASGLDVSPGSPLITGVENRNFVGTTYVGSVVGSREEEAHRLDAGFVGADAAGRHVDAPPFAAYKPALDALAEDYRREVGDAVNEALQP
jgi:hypothetical protein